MAGWQDAPVISPSPAAGGSWKDAPEVAPSADMGRYGAGQWSGQSYIDAANRVKDWAPAIGGVVGALEGGGVPGAALGGAAGEAARQLVNRAEGKPAPQTSLDAAKGIGVQGVVQGAAEGVGKLAGMAATKAAPWLMQSALKPTQTLLKNYGTTAPKVVQTLLDEGVNVSAGGLRELGDLLSFTNKQIADKVASARALVDKGSVLGRVGSTYDRFGAGLDARSAATAITGEGEKLIDHPNVTGDTMTVQQAQSMKQAIYREVKDAYGQISKPAVEAKKAIARGLKEEIASAVPGVTELNAKDSRLMAANDAVARRVTVAGNRDPVGFAWAAHSPATFLAALMDRHPVVKSMVANAMWKSASAVTGVAPQVIRAAVHQLASDDSVQADDQP